MLMFMMALVTIITTKMPIIAHLSVVCHQLVIEELDVFVFSHQGDNVVVTSVFVQFPHIDCVLDHITILQNHHQDSRSFNIIVNAAHASFEALSVNSLTIVTIFVIVIKWHL